jgi:hypothetical protein
MSDLSPTERAVRVIVAQHLPGIPAERASSYAERIHITEPLQRIGLTDGAFVAATLAIEATYGFDLPDEEWEAAKTPADLAKIVDQYARAEEVA